MTTVEMRHDVFRFLFKDKGVESKRKGWLQLQKEHFDHCRLPALWHAYVHHLGDGKKVVFPVLVRPVLQWGAKASKRRQNGDYGLLPRYYKETVKICFSTQAHTVNL